MSFSTFFLLGRVSFALDHLPLLNCRCTFCRLGHLPPWTFAFPGQMPPSTNIQKMVYLPSDVCRP